MIIVKLQGGLGNQLFQYACGRAVSLKWDAPLYLDISFYPDFNKREYNLHQFNIRGKTYAETFLGRIFSLRRYRAIKYVEKEPFKFDSQVFESGKQLYLVGYFQSFRYFEHCTELLRNELVLSHKLLPKDIIDYILKTNSVAIHVRRGDYIHNEIVSEKLGFCGLSYYKKAIDYISDNVSDPVFFIFSDDISWCQKELLPYINGIICDSNSSSADLMLIKHCKHHIVSNSSFSWWGAFLSEYKNSINIIPKPWLKSGKFDTSDLILPNWIQISR
ncbi:MAG: alpha-1,2-fucosyltransferase [Proteobacteria bacterium]|nr:alpha-1,2-fucosyltransferase [Pseudomonadota bacterium]